MKKEDILEATIRLISKKDNHSVSLGDIADSLGCRKQSLYSHFKNKDELIRQSFIYAGRKIEIPGLKVNFKNSVAEIFHQLAFFYIGIFKGGIARDYLSAIYVLSEFSIRDSIGVDDITYMFETQAFFIFNELKERGRIADNGLFDYLSHLISLSIMEMIVGYSDDEKAEYDIGKLTSFLEKLF